MSDGEHVGEILPRAHEAIVEPAKLRGYLLDPEHPAGASKARFFRTVLHTGPDEADHLADQLRAGLATAPAAKVRQRPGGEVYTVTMTITGPHGHEARVTTAWQVRPDAPPRLVTAYPG